MGRALSSRCVGHLRHSAEKAWLSKRLIDMARSSMGTLRPASVEDGRVEDGPGPV